MSNRPKSLLRTDIKIPKDEVSKHKSPWPDKAYEPKVMVPYTNPPGGVPRKIVIERKRRLYESQNIKQLLKLEGIDYSQLNNDPNNYENLLPLEAFDDTDFDPRTPEEWMELGMDGDTFKYIPAKGLFFDKDGLGFWKDCRVVGYEGDNRYLVEADFLQERKILPRIHLMFKAEDPVNFAKRVAAAHKKRREAESLIKYNLYIDSMPIDEIPPLSEQSRENICKMALNSKKLRESKLSVEERLGEIALDYARTMNKIVFNLNLQDESQKELFSFLNLPEKKEKETPWLGVYPIPEYDYEGLAKKFKFHTYFKQREILLTLLKIRNYCYKKQSERIFALPPSKTTNLDEFEQIQTQEIDKLTNSINDIWLMEITKCIKDGLSNVGKGWLNIHYQAQDREIYEMSKLKKFMIAVRLMMQDCLKYLMLDSLEFYSTFFQNQCNYHVETKSISEVIVHYPPDYTNKNDDIPIFQLDLTAKEDEFYYNTPLEKFIEVVEKLYDYSISKFQKFIQVEYGVMNQFFWGEKQYLQTIPPNDPRVISWKECVIKSLQKAIEPLQKYIQFYDEFLPLLKLNPKEYINKYQKDEHSIDDMKKEVLKHLRTKESVQKKIPQRLRIGIFSLECTSIRNRLAKKAQELADSVLNHISKLAKNNANKVRDAFSKISREISKQPKNIKQLTDIKDFMQGVPQEVEEIKAIIAEMRAHYDILESFRFSLSDEDFRSKCIAIEWPKKLQEQMERVEKYLETEKARFKEILAADKKIFLRDLEKIERVVAGFSKHNDLSRVADVAHEVKILQKQIKDAQAQAKDFNMKEILFGEEPKEYSQLNKITKNFQPYADLWLSAFDWITWQNEWRNDPFENLDAEKVKNDVSLSSKKIQKCVTYFQEMPPIYEIAKTIQNQINEFKPNVPLITAIRNPGLRDRHWVAISKAIGFDVIPGENIKTLQDAFDLKLIDHLEKIQKVSDVASKEYTIEMALKKMKDDWKDCNFEVKPYRDTGTFVIKVSEEVQQLLDDQIALTQQIGFSAHKAIFEDEIIQWEQQLNLVQEIIEEWLSCQREWMALEPIFSAPEIIKQLPQLHKKFKLVDSKWRKYMSLVSVTPNIMTFCTQTSKLLKVFQENNVLLASIQKGLDNYLEAKRKAFARLYFLADEELLQILAQAKEPRAVQPYLNKCFENIEKLKFEDNNDMTSMFASGGEEVKFVEPVQPEGSVEIWLKKVEYMMKQSVKKEIRLAIQDYSTENLEEWILKWPAQVVLVVSQIMWTKNVTESLTESGVKGLKEYKKLMGENLIKITDLVKRKLDNLQRTKLGALITIEVHAGDVVSTMIENNVNTTSDFEWVSQLRFYWENDNCRVKQVEAEFDYGYEYLGNTTRLVITPLTDRIYLTLTGALHLNLGGAPAGPAGTGKTETVKDLAKALAKQCVVFNCQEGLDEMSMGKFFKGLVMSGAWACFDEFNRIDIEVLSVVAQQISSLQNAINTGKDRIEFEGTVVSVDPTFAVFITMNPGYAGRTELPDNLKALFRPVACMVPDYALIAEIRLFSFGFRDAKKLAQKMVATFRLASEQLSSQEHYDFGMRAVNTVIAAAGLLRRDASESSEEILLLRALKDSNLPKFLSNDVVLFNGIINDLFPNITPPKVDYGVLMDGLMEAVEHFGLQPVDEFLQKCIQLHETTILRHGLMLVGPTGGGKTSCYKCLQRALSQLAIKGISDEYKVVKTSKINPKSITMAQLYGEYDRNTREWKDGILANEYRKFTEDTSDTKKWLIFDGPVDAEWIESMNTVLDDNRKLCLVNGSIIPLSASMNIIFEVDNLAQASPATVSRCGMVYLDPSLCVPLSALVSSYLDRLPEIVKPYREQIQKLCDCLLLKSIKFLRDSEDMKEYIPSMDSALVESCFKLLDCFFVNYIREEDVHHDDEGSDDPTKKLPNLIEPLFLFSVIWSVGATVDTQGRLRFDIYFRQLMNEHKIQLNFPKEGTVYDYMFNEENETWVHWLNTIPEFVLDPKKKFRDIIVPTTDTIRYSWLIKKLLSNQKHVLCVGPTGTGKSLVINELLMRGMPSQFEPLFVYFSARTEANTTQNIIDAKLQKHRKGVYGPPRTKEYVIFVDDVNMPRLEKYGAQPPIELLRQLLDHGGWYEYKTERLPFRKIVNVTLVGAMGPPGGGRNPVTPRFIRQFNIIAFPEMENPSVKKIFGKILTTYAQANFSDEIKSITENMIDASIELYNKIRDTMLPTPTKSHYTYNLRDLAKVFQGVLSADPKSIRTVDEFIRLWCHECSRVFEDRLINDEDKNQFKSLIQDVMNRYYNKSWDEIVTTRLIYGDFGSETRSYEQITNLDELVKITEEQLELYNNSVDKPMNLVMFLDAIEHVARISRIIRQPGGNALLLGVGGSGRQSLTRLAAFIGDYKVFQVEITKSFTMKEWKEFLKEVMNEAGLQDNPVVFLFCDTQIVESSMLEDINNLLNSGDIPNLFDQAEKEEIFNALKPLCIREKLPQNPTSTYAQFVKRVRDNLHIVLAMSPVGEVFRNRLRMFPSLVNCCTIDWFSEWPYAALKSVAEEKLGKLKLDKNVIEMCVYIHQSVAKISERYLQEVNRENHVTPTSYLELLQTVEHLLGTESQKFQTIKKNLQTGLSILQETEEKVSKLKIELTEKQPILIQTQKDIDEKRIKVEKDTEEANKTKEIVEKEEREASEKERECSEYKEFANRELQKALPALEESIKSLKNLQPKDINEVAKYTTPNPGIKLIMEAVCQFFGKTPKRIVKDGEVTYDWWAPSKELLGLGKRFVEMCVNYDKDNIDEAIIRKIQKYIENPDFTPEKARSLSQACAALCEFVIAMNTYYHVSKEIEPKRKALAKAEEELRIIQARLNKVREELQKVVDQIKENEDEIRRLSEQKETLAREVEDCTIKLDRAGRLIDGLAGEKMRWTETLEDLDAKLENIVGDMLLHAGFVAYAGPFTSTYRADLEADWKNKLRELGIPFSEKAKLTDLVEPLLIRSWTQSGLPTDILSIQNAIIMNKARRWPLMIDPQDQANKWIKNMEKDRNLKVITLSQPDYLRTLLNCVQFGNPVLIENVGEELDPALEPILLKQTFIQSGAPYIKIGDDAVPYNPDFKLYLTTKLRNPRYTPETAVKVTLLNFFITPQGLEDQLLGTVVKMERPELENMKNELMIKNMNNKKNLKQIQDDILKMLTDSTGDVLENEKLINALGESKKQSDIIKERVREAEETEKEIDETRNKYLVVANRASVLFFCVTDLTLVDPMYQYSLQWFIKLFILSIENAEQSDDLNTRLNNLINHFTYALYNNVCQSLFARHKLLFSFLLAIKILQSQNKIDPKEWRFFLTGGTHPTNPRENPDKSWLQDIDWMQIQCLGELENFNGFVDDFIENLESFKKYYESNTAFKDPIPGKFNEKLDAFQKILILKSIRPDQVSRAIYDFVCLNLGKKFVEPPRFDLMRSFRDSSNTTPLVFILSAGADPKSELDKFADQMQARYKSISLGRGTEETATYAIQDAIQTGSWVLLQNCHLAISFMPKLEALVDSFTEQNHKGFRLWLTSMPDKHFPVTILQNAVKMTLEPPHGLKENLLGSYDSFNDDLLEHPVKPKEFKKLLFGLCFFHAIIQERRKFGPLGWNISYEFTNGDLKVCIQQLALFLEKYTEVPYKVLKFLTGEINYGGRVTDNWDRRTLNTIIQDFITPEIMQDGYKFSSLDEYISIEAKDYESYISYMKSLPANPTPEVFGLHTNAEITYNRSELSEMVDIILSLQPKDAPGMGVSREQVIESVAKEIDAIIPNPFDLKQVQEKYPTTYEESMNTVLVQEVMRYNKLLKIVKQSLKEILRALKGLVVMSESLENMGTSLFNNQVPEMWSNAYPSLMPLSSWVSDLMVRLEFIQEWYEKGTPKVFWISRFCFPQAFLTGTLQNYARKYKVSIDTISFGFEILKETKVSEIVERPKEGCYITGLFMEGARWDPEKRTITESYPKELYTSMPIIWLNPIENRKKPTRGIYECPVYKTLSRAGTLSTTGHSTNFILPIEVPSDKPQEHWIKRGVAMLCSLKYFVKQE